VTPRKTARIRASRDMGADAAARRLAARRVALGIPLSLLAQTIGVSQSTVSRLESTGRVSEVVREEYATALARIEAERRPVHLLLTRTVDGVRYTVHESGCAGWTERRRSVRVAVVHCHNPALTGVPHAAWAVTVRLEDGERVEAHDASARSLPDEIEREVIALLLSARRAA